MESLPPLPPLRRDNTKMVRMSEELGERLETHRKRLGYTSLSDLLNWAVERSLVVLDEQVAKPTA